MPTLTKRQIELLDFLNTFTSTNGYAPTLIEMAKHMNCTSLATIHEHLENLANKGVITRQQYIPRASVLVTAREVKPPHTVERDRSYSSYLYFIENPAAKLVKIGRTCDVKKRLRELEALCGQPLILRCVVPNGGAIEQALHKAFAADRVLGEWFRYSLKLKQLLRTKPTIRKLNAFVHT